MPITLSDETLAGATPPPEEEQPVEPPPQQVAPAGVSETPPPQQAAVVEAPPQQAPQAAPPPDEKPAVQTPGTLENLAAGPQPGLSAPLQQPEAVPPAEQIGDVLGEAVAPYQAMLPEPVRNLTDIIGQPAQAIAGSLGEAGQQLQEVDPGGAVGEILTNIPGGPQQKVISTTEQRLAEGKPAIPQNETFADPGQIPAIWGGETTTYGPLPILTGLTFEDYWTHLSPEEQATLTAAGPGAPHQAWIEYSLHGEGAVPPPSLVNPFDRGTHANPIENIPEVAVGFKDMLGGIGASSDSGTLQPFLINMAQQTVEDPTILIPGAWGEAARGKVLGVAKKLPVIKQLGEYTAAEKVRLRGEQVGTAAEETARAAEAQLPAAERWGTEPVPEPGRPPQAPSSNGATQPGLAPEVPPPDLSDRPQLRVEPAPDGRTIYGASTPGGTEWSDDMAQMAADYPALVDPTGRIDPITMQRMRDTYVQRQTLERQVRNAVDPPAERPTPTVAPRSGVPIRTDPMNHPLATELRRQLTQRGLGDYGVKVVNKLSEVLDPAVMRAMDGSELLAVHDQARKLITVALDTVHADTYRDLGLPENVAQRIRVSALLDHEVVHAIRSMDLFNPTEWDALVGSARSNGIDRMLRDSKGELLAPYRHLDEAGLQEEMVAHLYQAYREGKLLADTPAASLLERFRQTLSALGASLRNTYPEQVLQRIDSGEIGSRRRGMEPGRYTEPTFSGKGPRRAGDKGVVQVPLAEYQARAAKEGESVIQREVRALGYDAISFLDEQGQPLPGLVPLGHLPDNDYAAVRRKPTLSHPETEKVPEPTSTPSDSTAVGDNPHFHLQNRNLFVGNGPGAAGLTDARIQELFDEADVGGRLMASASRQKALSSLRLPSAQMIHEALSQPWNDILWYEDGTQAIMDTVDLPLREQNTFMNFLGGTSQNTKPRDNLFRTIGSMAEHLQGQPIRTPTRGPGAIKQATRQWHLSSPKYQDYTGSFKYLSGMIDTAPGTVLDLWMARSMGLPTNAAMQGQTYRVLSKFHDLLRDEINTLHSNAGTLPHDMPLQVWHLQSAIWNVERGSVPGGTSIARHMPEVLKKIRDAGIPLSPDGKMIPETFFDPATIDTFGSTAGLYANMAYASFAERHATGVVNRAFEAAQALPPKLQTAYRTKVSTPFHKAVQTRVMPLLREMIAGQEIESRAIDFSPVRLVDGEFEQSAAIPLGGLEVKGGGRYYGDAASLAAASLAHHLGISEVHADQLRNPDFSRATSQLEMQQLGESITYELFFPDAAQVTDASLIHLQEITGRDLKRTKPKTGGAVVVLDSVPGEIVDDAAIEASLHVVWPGDDVPVHMNEMLRRSEPIDVGNYEQKRSEWIRGQHDIIGNGGDEAVDSARQSLGALVRFEAESDAVRREWETASREFLGEPDLNSLDVDAANRIPAVVPKGAAVVREQVTNQKKRTAARAALSASAVGFREFVDKEMPYDPHFYLGVYASEASTKLMKESSAGQFRFRDGSRPPPGMTNGEVVHRTMSEVKTWLDGYDRNGNPRSWATSGSRTGREWQRLESKYNPHGDVDVTKLIEQGDVTPGIKTTASDRRLDFTVQVMHDAIQNSVPSAKRTALTAAFGHYMNFTRQAMLFNVLTAPVYAVKNLTSNSINILMRGGGIKPVLDVLTNTKEWGRVLGNMRDNTPTTLNAIEKHTGMGTRPNMQMTMRPYFDRVGGQLPKYLDIPLNVIAPGLVRDLASVPDQLGRESIGVFQIQKGYRALNKTLVPSVYDALRRQRGMEAFLPSVDRVQRVVGDFLEENRRLPDANTGEPLTGLLGQPTKFEAMWNPDALKSHLSQHLFEDVPANRRPPEGVLNRALNELLGETRDSVGRIGDEANATVDHALFSWRDTKGDAVLGQVTMFHYWMSRQGGFYVSEGMKRPWMAAAYGRAMAEMERQNQELDGPDWLTSFFQFNQSVGGFTTFFSPFDAFQSIATMADWQWGDDPSKYDDLTRIGQAFNAIPFFIHPLIQLVAYDIGALGPDFRAPDPSGTGTFGAKAIGLMNLANAEGAAFMAPFNAMGIGVDSHGNKIPIAPRPIQDLMGRVGNAISTAFEPITGLSAVEPTPSWAGITQDIQTIGQQETRANHPEWDDGTDEGEMRIHSHVTDVMADPGNPEYTHWYGMASSEQQQFGNLPQPLGGIARNLAPFQTQTMPEQEAINKFPGEQPGQGLQPSGQTALRPESVTGPMADKALAANRYDDSSTVEGRQLGEWDLEYQNLVPPDIKAAKAGADAISKCKDATQCYLTENIEAGGLTYTPADLQGMKGSERTQVREAYLQDHGVTQEQIDGVYAAQNEYLADHPDVAAFGQWKDLISAAGPEAFVADAIQHNPGFATYVQSNMTDHITGVINYDAVWGTDAFLAAQGVRTSVYTPEVGNEPSTAPGGYPSIPGIQEGQPLLPTASVKPEVGEAPIYISPSDFDYPDASFSKAPVLVVPSRYEGPIQVLDQRLKENAGKPLEDQLVLISVQTPNGPVQGYMQTASLNNTSQQRPTGGGQVQQPGGGLTEQVGKATAALGAAKDVITGGLGSMMPTLPSGNGSRPPAAVPSGPDNYPANDQPMTTDETFDSEEARLAEIARRTASTDPAHRRAEVIGGTSVDPAAPGSVREQAPAIPTTPDTGLEFGNWDAPAKAPSADTPPPAGGNPLDAIGAGLGAVADGAGGIIQGLIGHNAQSPVKPNSPAITPAVRTGKQVIVPSLDGQGIATDPVASDQTWMEDMVGKGHATVTSPYKSDAPGPRNPDPTKATGYSTWYDYQLLHGADNMHHAGYDIACDTGNCWGTPIFSPVDGVVGCAGYGVGSSGFKNATCGWSAGTTALNNDGTAPAHTVTMKVGEDAAGGDIVLSFNHLGTSDLQPGQTIKAGEPLATMGNGDCPGMPCPHLHLEAWIYDPVLGDFRIVDPALVVSGYYATHAVSDEGTSPGR